MGGIGSGMYSRRGRHRTAEEARDIDIRYLHKSGQLVPSYAGAYHWTCNGRPSGDIRYKVGHNTVTLMYRVKQFNGDWESVEQTVPITWTACHYGGMRPWFTCTRCSKRVAVLYGEGKYFLCRHCYDLRYMSQQETHYDRAERKLKKLHKRLKRAPSSNRYSLCYSTKIRPKRMRKTTFERLREQETRLIHQVWQYQLYLDSLLEQFQTRRF